MYKLTIFEHLINERISKSNNDTSNLNGKSFESIRFKKVHCDILLNLCNIKYGTSFFLRKIVFCNKGSKMSFIFI